MPVLYINCAVNIYILRADFLRVHSSNKPNKLLSREDDYLTKHPTPRIDTVNPFSCRLFYSCGVVL